MAPLLGLLLLLLQLLPTFSALQNCDSKSSIPWSQALTSALEELPTACHYLDIDNGDASAWSHDSSTKFTFPTFVYKANEELPSTCAMACTHYIYQSKHTTNDLSDQWILPSLVMIKDDYMLCYCTPRTAQTSALIYGATPVNTVGDPKFVGLLTALPYVDPEACKVPCPADSTKMCPAPDSTSAMVTALNSNYFTVGVPNTDSAANLATECKACDSFSTGVYPAVTADPSSYPAWLVDFANKFKTWSGATANAWYPRTVPGTYLATTDPTDMTRRTCIFCQAGEIFTNDPSQFCQACEAGKKGSSYFPKFLNLLTSDWVNNNNVCTICDGDSYQPEAGKSSCETCEDGYTYPLTGSPRTECSVGTPCPAGSFCINNYRFLCPVSMTGLAA
jgi:hypothetical protein